MNKYLRLFLLLLALISIGYLLVFRHNTLPDKEPPVITYWNAAGLPDSVVVSAGPQYSRGPVGTFFLGKHNRALWTARVKAKVFYLQKELGGLKIQQVGGGMQTLSFTLIDAKGRTYALRSVDKDPISVLPPLLQKTVAGSFVRDQISGANPYGALVVPVLAKAAGIFHVSPQLRYIPLQDSSLGKYARRAGGKLFMLEEKHTTNPAFYPELGNPTAIVNTAAMLQQCSRDSTYQIDANNYLKCRLFDILIEDWDRHNGQWMWAAYKRGNETWFRPIPKDRDQAFCNYQDGLLPWLATRRWALPKFGQFTAGIDNIYGLTVNAAYLDSLLLTKLTEDQFVKTAQELQKCLPDTIINQSVRELPKSIQTLTGSEISTHLKTRRNHLPRAARKFYQVVASNKRK